MNGEQTRWALGPVALLLGPLLWTAVGCTAAHKATKVDPASFRRIEMDPIKFKVQGGKVVLDDPASSVSTLFVEAGDLFEAKQYQEAADLYRRIIKEFPQHNLITSTYYNLGLSLESLEHWEEARQAYLSVIQREPDSADALNALYRIGNCLENLERWQESLDLFVDILKRDNLRSDDMVEAKARLATAMMKLERPDEAEKELRFLFRYVKDIKNVEEFERNRFLAMAHFHMGEIFRGRFETVPLRLPEHRMAVDLELKASLFISSLGQFIKSIKVGDPYWATASGFRIGALYEKFYEDLLHAEVPKELNAEEKVVYGEELRKKIKPLLHKAIQVYEKDILMSERVGVYNDWVKDANERLAKLKEMLALETKKEVAKELGTPQDHPNEPPPVQANP